MLDEIKLSSTLAVVFAVLIGMAGTLSEGAMPTVLITFVNVAAVGGMALIYCRCRLEVAAWSAATLRDVIVCTFGPLLVVAPLLTALHARYGAGIDRTELLHLGCVVAALLFALNMIVFAARFVFALYR